MQNYVLQAGGGKPLVCKPYKAKLCMAAKLLAGGGKPLVCKPYKAKLCMAAKLLAEGGKTPCKTTFCKPYKAYKAKLCTSFVRRLQALQSKALYGVCKPKAAKLCKALSKNKVFRSTSFCNVSDFVPSYNMIYYIQAYTIFSNFHSRFALIKIYTKLHLKTKLLVFCKALRRKEKSESLQTQNLNKAFV